MRPGRREEDGYCSSRSFCTGVLFGTEAVYCARCLVLNLWEQKTGAGMPVYVLTTKVPFWLRDVTSQSCDVTINPRAVT
eukprot:3235018-Rhodomonas_salina.2